MRDGDDLKDLKREYMELVRVHGDEVAELEALKESLLDLNRRHRLEAVKMYVKAIAKVESRVGRQRARRNRRG